MASFKVNLVKVKLCFFSFALSCLFAVPCFSLSYILDTFRINFLRDWIQFVKAIVMKYK